MNHDLTDAELETYARQIVLAEIGYDGQRKLRKARACLVGLGGLGSPTATKLVAMGIGYLRMVDRDVVSRSDLHRQYLYDVKSVGEPKVEAAFRKLTALNPDVKLDPVPESLHLANAKELIRDVDIVLDGLDRPEPRYLINRTCHTHKIPFVFGAAIESVGNVTTLVPGETFCLECFMPGLRDQDLPVCGVVGVHPSVLGIVSAIQVSEAVKLLTGQSPKLLNRLLYIDLGELEFSTITGASLPDCPVCGIHPSGPPKPLRETFFEETCARDGRRNFVISPRKRVEINLRDLKPVLKRRGFVIKRSSDFGITFEQPEGITSCLLKSGVMITQTPPKVKTSLKGDVFETYKSVLVDGLGLSSDILSDV